MLSVYHRGSVARHLPASPARIHHLLSIKISRVRINLSHRRTHAHKYTLRLLERQSEREGKKMIEKEGKEWQLRWKDDRERRGSDYQKTAEEWLQRWGRDLREKRDKGRRSRYMVSKQRYRARHRQKGAAVRRCYHTGRDAGKYNTADDMVECNCGRVSEREIERVRDWKVRETERNSADDSWSSACLTSAWGFDAACQPLLSLTASPTASLTCTPTAVYNLCKPVTTGLNEAGGRLQVFFSVSQGQPCMPQTRNALINIWVITFCIKWLCDAVQAPTALQPFCLSLLASFNVLLWFYCTLKLEHLASKEPDIFSGVGGDQNRDQRKVNIGPYSFEARLQMKASVTLCMQDVGLFVSASIM